MAVVRAAERYLAERSVDAPRLSAELLTAHVLDVSRLELYMLHDRPMSEAERVRLRPLVGERGRGVPVAYLLEEWDFCGLTFHVTPAVLVPRPETEELVELAAERCPQGGRCADLGTGSGAIAIALALRRPDVAMTATERSPEAAALARRNAERHGVAERVHVLEGSWWEPLTGPPFDVVLCNPPYIDPSRDDLVEPEVRAFEPAEALFAAPGDPASAYREVLADAPSRLAPQAWLIFETGVEAATPAEELLRQAPFLDDVELRPDLAGQPRYLLARAR
ncbi:MAG: peptide chain release factor N(5)-glutamine methyltransferase [Planctomycetota bacterium]